MALPSASTSSHAAAPPMPRGARFEPLAARAPVAIHRSACLRLRTHLAQCRACAMACPTQAIRAGAQSLELGEGCAGCGRCQAACPTGALAVDGFDALVLPACASHGTVAIDCHRAPPTDDAALRVPCLGGLSEARLLTLCAEAAEARVDLRDRGLCGACDSGGADHPALATLQRVVALMGEAGVPAPLLPTIERMATRGSVAGRAIDPMQHPGRARRGLFTALARPSSGPPRAAGSITSSEPSRERQQTIAALELLVARHGGRMPRALFHRLEVGADCRGHRVCASACPTGALLRYRDDAAARMGLAFDNLTCLGCGHCAAVCPEQALTLRWGGGEVGQGRRPITGFVQRECPNCGSRFATKDQEAETHCGRCRTSAGLARSAFQTLFGARPRTPGNGVNSTEELR